MIKTIIEIINGSIKKREKTTVNNNAVDDNTPKKQVSKLNRK